jgi:hypothetical protein
VSGLDLTAEYADLRAVLNAATGTLATIRDAGDLYYVGEPFEPPEPSGKGGSLAMFITVDMGRIDGSPDTFGVEMGRANLDFGVFVEVGEGARAKALEICDDLKAAFQSQDTAAMQYDPEEAYPSNEGEFDERWFRIDYQLPFTRREAA